MPNTKVKIYYIILLLVLGIKVVTTIFTNGLAVHHGKKVAQLQIQKNNLLQQELRLSSELSHKSSLSQIVENYDISEYKAINNPITISVSNTVASN